MVEEVEVERRRVGEEGSEETRELIQRVHRCLQSLALRSSVTFARCKRMLTERLCLQTQEWSASNALASNYHCSCSLLAIASTLPLDQGNPVAFILVHAGLVCLGRYPSIDYQLALAVARGPSNRVPIFLSH
jgi:hypothetical protein